MDKKKKIELKDLKLNQPSRYEFKIKNCPGYEGYKPKNLSHEVCKHCGSIEYYH